MYKLQLKHSFSSFLFCLCLVIFLNQCMLNNQGAKINELPKYIDINDPDCTNKAILTTPAKRVNFPLTADDLTIVRLLETKFDTEKGCAGLAAPQLGFSKQIIIFALHNTDPELNARRHITDVMPKTIWFNPQYRPAKKAKKEIDYEACFSVSGVVGPVSRYDSIVYSAYDATGKLIRGTAHGFLARIIQHEVDHVRGILYTTLVPKEKLLTMDEYKLLVATKYKKVNNHK